MKPVEMPRLPQVVNIEKRKKTAARLPDSTISRSGRTLLMLAKIADVLGWLWFHARSIIHQHDFLVGKLLHLNRCQRRGEKLGSVMRRNDDADHTSCRSQFTTA